MGDLSAPLPQSRDRQEGEGRVALRATEVASPSELWQIRSHSIPGPSEGPAAAVAARGAVGMRHLELSGGERVRATGGS